MRSCLHVRCTRSQQNSWPGILESWVDLCRSMSMTFVVRFVISWATTSTDRNQNRISPSPARTPTARQRAHRSNATAARPMQQQLPPPAGTATTTALPPLLFDWTHRACGEKGLNRNAERTPSPCVRTGARLRTISAKFRHTGSCMHPSQAMQ